MLLIEAFLMITPMHAPFRLLASVWLALALAFTAQAQGVGIGTSGPPVASAALEVKSTTGGLLLPRLTAAQRAAVPSPAEGLLVFQTDGTPGLYYYIGGLWLNMTNGLIPDASGNAGASPRVRVSTLAGNSSAGFNDATGGGANFNGPTGLAFDGSGILYVADAGNNRIRKIVIATGVTTTLAGNGGNGNNDGTGTGASFSYPSSVAYSSGNLYVADQGNHLIRKIVVATGVTTTLAGARIMNEFGDYIGDAGYNDATGTAAQFNGPAGVACDASGNVYVGDQGNRRIRKIMAATGVTTTLAGNSRNGSADGTGTAAQFSVPTGVAYDGSGNLYVSDYGNHLIRKIVLATAAVTTLAGNGVAGNTNGTGTTAQFNVPTRLACDGSGNVYVADRDNYVIRKIVVATGAVTTLAGTGAPGFADGTGTIARFYNPFGVACDGSGNVYVADQGNQRIRVIR